MQSRKLEINKIFVVSVSAVLLILFSIIEPEKMGWGSCKFKDYTGLSCPTCGITRSVNAAVNYEFIEAVKYNPFGLVILGTLIFIIMKNSTELVINRRVFPKLNGRVVKQLSITILILWFLYWLIRLYVEFIS